MVEDRSDRSPDPAEDATTDPATSSPTNDGTTTTGENWESRFKYLMADFDNYRRRAERDLDSIRVRARADLLRQILPLYEAFARAEEATEHLSPTDPIRKGLDLIGKEFHKVLDREGIEPVAKPGDRFDAEFHEAVAEAPSDADHPEGSIVEVVQQGYRTLHGVLRPAKVVIAGKDAARDTSDGPEEPAATGAIRHGREG
ncbi:MAG: nucleotide exchange factor GrpE [Thermoplasmata archaeon]|jgi:molecular chaperone GrpE